MLVDVGDRGARRQGLVGARVPAHQLPVVGDRLLELARDLDVMALRWGR